MRNVWLDQIEREKNNVHAPLPGLVPAARHAIVPVVEQKQLARDTYRLRLAAPELAREVIPGQFFMIRSPGTIGSPRDSDSITYRNFSWIKQR